jgi:GH25 family lysozyme M1 (1,4-beta-N-acetylmuramidase)
MKGADVSHWQGNIDWSKFDLDFALLKVTEGQSYVDATFEKNRAGARKKGVLVGYYHFAAGTDAKKEADFFLKTVGDLQEGELLALDFEIQIANPVVWCKAFLDRIADKTGISALIYMNSSTAKSFNWSSVFKNYGLWIAQYFLPNDGSKHGTPNIGNFPYYVIWQYTSRGACKGIVGNVDLNTTDIDMKTLKKHGAPKPKVVVKPIEVVPVKTEQTPIAPPIPEIVALEPEQKVAVLESVVQTQQVKIENQATQIQVITDKHSVAKTELEQLRDAITKTIEEIPFWEFVSTKFKKWLNL